MRREFTAISASAMVISFLAAVVLCLQISQIKMAPEWQIPAPVVDLLELAIFGTAVYLWQRAISFSGWVLGIAGLFLVRTALTLLAATALSMLEGFGSFHSAFALNSAPAPRMCAVVFALMVLYPLRVLLPVRQTRKVANRDRFANSPAVNSALAMEGQGEPTMVLVGGKQQIPVWHAAPQKSAEGEAVAYPSLDLEGTIEVPLKPLLALLPEELSGEGAGRYEDSHPVAIPLAAIVPQLKEARVVVSLYDLADWLPRGAMAKLPESDEGNEEAASIILPLELVVPRLPPEVLELPPPSPPAWAEVEEAESVVFATI